MEGEEDEMQDSRRRDQQQRKKKKLDKYRSTIYPGYCNVRIHVLAQPKRWLLLFTYKNYQHVFEAKRAQAIKEKVQELFGMTPEEAELYFNTLRKKKPRKIDLRVLKLKLRREKKEARAKACAIFENMMCKAIKYSYRHAPPLLVTPMLRMISDNMLELLVSIHDIEMPTRTTPDKFAQLLISIADWVAVFVSNIYYELEIQDRKEQQDREEAAALPGSESTVTTIPDKEVATGLTNYEQDNAYQETDNDELLMQEGE